MIVSERLEHSSVTMTLDTYSYAIRGLQRTPHERVAALIPGLSFPDQWLGCWG